MASPNFLIQKPVWKAALKSCADPVRSRNFLFQLLPLVGAKALTNCTKEQARILCALLSGSQAMSELLVAHPEWLAVHLDADLLMHPRREQGLEREVTDRLAPALAAGDYPTVFAQIRQFKQQQMLRIAARDLARLARVSEVTREISNVADVCLSNVLHLCRAQLTKRLGEPYHLDAEGRWQPTQFCVVGLGKLGGQELNYSSDVDVLFVYSEEGNLFREPPTSNAVAKRGLTSHQFFKRLAEAFIAEVSQMTSDGMLYRIDLRLRPEGNAGPLVRSLASYENYYAQGGQTWERMMLIKARGVAGDAALAHDFQEMVQPFRYPRSLSEGVLREIAAMKERIETEVVKAGELDRNVKLGRGGIREIEFVAQTLQILNAGRNPFLHEPHTLSALKKLVSYKLLGAGEATRLASAYEFLRDVEHRLQMENNLQTHSIPSDVKSLQRLAGLMGFKRAKDFEGARALHTHNVRQVYDNLLKGAAVPASRLHGPVDAVDADWPQTLADHSFRDIPKSCRLLKLFMEGPGYVHVSERTRELARGLLARFLEKCPKKSKAGVSSVQRGTSATEEGLAMRENRRDACPTLSDPDRVLARLDSFIAAYGNRAILYETWAHNPSLFDLLLLLFDRSEFLAEVAIATPDLVDELVLSGRLRRRKSAAEILKDLQHGRSDDDQRLWLRRYHQAELMRIGLRDILGLADFEQNFVELTALADGCLQYALEVVQRKNKLKAEPFVIIGLGKLGGSELNYGSDLDIIFVADAKTNVLPRLQGMAVELMDLLSSRTEMGIAFVTDARLRPDGEKGLLVNTLPAFEKYYRRRAHLWEIQALTRVRPIAGDFKLGEQFLSLAGELTNFKQASQRGETHPSRSELSEDSFPKGQWRPVARICAYSTDWKKQIAQMRARIEKERTPPGKDALAIKTGAGGLIDAEFVAQALCLEHGWQEANTLNALRRAQETNILSPGDAVRLIENYRQLRRGGIL